MYYVNAPKPCRNPEQADYSVLHLMRLRDTKWFSKFTLNLSERM